MGIETVGDLIAALEDYDEDTPVRFAHQPSWPFEYTIADVVTTDAAVEGEPAEPVVWLAEGTQVGYLPGHAAEALGWAD